MQGECQISTALWSSTFTYVLRINGIAIAPDCEVHAPEAPPAGLGSGTPAAANADALADEASV